MVHLFGEIDINLNEDPEKLFKRVWRIAEQCGYSIERDSKNLADGSEHFLIFGEDFDDNYLLVNYVNIWKNKINSLQKVIYSDEYQRVGLGGNGLIIKRTMHKVYTYNPKLDEWKMSFNGDQYRKEHGQNEFVEVIT